MGRFDRSAIQKIRIRFTGSRAKTLSSMVLIRSFSTLKSAASAIERGADDRRQVADVFRDQEIMLHEPLDVGLARPGRIAELAGDRALYVEAEPLLGAAGEKMQSASHRPQELLASPEKRKFPVGEETRGDEVMHVMDAIDVFRDPEQRVQIAQAAFALFHIGLDQIARR